MAHRGIVMVGFVAVVLAAVLWEGAVAQSTGCTNTLISLSPCLNYISGNSSTPSPSCCSQLASVVNSQPQCLCQVLNGGGSSMGLNINQTQALALPGACSVKTPSISACSTGASPSASPAGTPDSPDTDPSGTGSKNVPTTEGEGGSSDASSTRMAIPLIFILMFVASYVSTSTL